MDADDRKTNGLWPVGFFAVVLVWIGTSLGVSFLATPAKFLAPSLSLPVALDVGRQTFAILNKLEWVYVAVALLLAARLRRPPAMIAIGTVALVTAAETFWLLPALDARVGTIIAGGVPPPSALHTLYIVAEVAKLVILAAIGTYTARRLARSLAPRVG